MCLFLDGSRKWNHTVCGPVCLASLTERPVFKACLHRGDVNASPLFMAGGHCPVWPDTLCVSISLWIDTWIVFTFWPL